MWSLLLQMQHACSMMLTLGLRALVSSATPATTPARAGTPAAAAAPAATFALGLTGMWALRRDITGTENTRGCAIAAGDELLLGMRRAARRWPLVEELGILTPRCSHLRLQSRERDKSVKGNHGLHACTCKCTSCILRGSL